MAMHTRALTSEFNEWCGRAFLKALMDIGYFKKFDRPLVSFEIKPWGDEDREVVIKTANVF